MDVAFQRRERNHRIYVSKPKPPRGVLWLMPIGRHQVSDFRTNVDTKKSTKNPFHVMLLLFYFTYLFMRMYMCVCTNVYLCVCANVYLCVRANVYTCVFARMYICVFVERIHITG